MLEKKLTILFGQQIFFILLNRTLALFVNSHTYFICPQPRIESSLLSRVLQRHSGAKMF